MKRFFALLFVAAGLLAASLSASAKEHTIKDGETLESIAQSYGVSTQDIRSLNPQIRIYHAGIIIRIPDSASAASASAASGRGKTSAAKSSSTATASNSPAPVSRKAKEYYQKWLENRHSDSKEGKKYAGIVLIEAAKLNHPEALYDYSQCLLYGHYKKEYKIKKDERKGIEMLCRSAYAGSVRGKYEIYECYNYRSYHRDYPELFPSEYLLTRWMVEAAEAGYQPAVHNIAMHYENGYSGFPKDLKKAQEYLEKGVLNATKKEIEVDDYHFKLNSKDLAKLLKESKNGQKAKEIASKLDNLGQQEAAKEFHLCAAENGIASEMVYLGDSYMEGTNGFYKSQKEALKWYEAAGAKGNRTAKTKASGIKQEIARKDEEQRKIAAEQKRKADERRRQEAIRRERQDQLEKDYQNGRALRISGRYDEALPLLERATRGGHPQATYELAVAYVNGQGKLDIVESARLYIKAAEMGVADAYFMAGTAYANGIGCQKDLSKTRDWYAKGIAAGDILCELKYKELQRGQIPPYYVAPLNNVPTTYSPEPRYVPQQETSRPRMKKCTKCNGTGLLTGNERFYHRTDGKCGGCVIGGDHVFINCKVCGKYHCSHISNHYECDWCKGTGMLEE